MHDLHTGWFRLNAQNCVPGNSSRRFFELDHEILHTYSGKQYLKLEEGGFLIFCLGGRLFGVPAGVLAPGGGQNPDISTAKPQIKKPPSSSFRYCLPEYVCKISWSNSKKRREKFPGTQFWAFNLNQPVPYEEEIAGYSVHMMRFSTRITRKDSTQHSHT